MVLEILSLRANKYGSDTGKENTLQRLFLQARDLCSLSLDCMQFTFLDYTET